MKNLDKYVLNEKNDIISASVNGESAEERIRRAEDSMNVKFPNELRMFYIKYGYGSINNMNFSCFNRLLAPLQCADVRLRRDYYANDPDLNTYIRYEYGCNMLIFFEVNEGIYLMIQLGEEEKNAIYYNHIKIADSLEEFLMKMYDDGAYYEEMVAEEYRKEEERYKNM